MDTDTMEHELQRRNMANKDAAHAHISLALHNLYRSGDYEGMEIMAEFVSDALALTAEIISEVLYTARMENTDER
jgi:hypothetical protein